MDKEEEKIEKILDALEKEYNYYTDLGYKLLEKDNLQGSQLHYAEASAFGRAKWIVEDIWYEREV